jgi:hypothetical protein
VFLAALLLAHQLLSNIQEAREHRWLVPSLFRSARNSAGDNGRAGVTHISSHSTMVRLVITPASVSNWDYYLPAISRISAIRSSRKGGIGYPSAR